jgi:flagellar biosynthetic protein FliQ
MSPDQTIGLMSQLLWKAALLAMPLLLTILIVGLLISIFQVVTQVQEMSLTFVPKLLACAAVLIVGGPWMLRQLVAYSTAMINNIPRLL